MGGGEAFALGCSGSKGTVFAEDAKVRRGLRTVVEAEDGIDVACELGWEIDAAFTDPIGDAVEGLVA